MKIESLVVMLLAAMFGCAERPASPPVESRPAEVDVEAPGVNVEVGGGKGVEVETPGTDVEIPPK
jgi:hypothetical protein